MNYYDEIKQELINNEITKKIKDYSKNKSDLTTYYNIGKMLNDAGKHYGEGIIKKYALKLTKEISSKYNETNLKRRRQFYQKIKNINQDDTIGIIICKKDNKFIMEYCSDERILSREYKII